MSSRQEVKVEHKVSEFVSFHALVMGFWSLTCRKFSTRVGVRGRDTQKLKVDQGWS